MVSKVSPTPLFLSQPAYCLIAFAIHEVYQVMLLRSFYSHFMNYTTSVEQYDDLPFCDKRAIHKAMQESARQLQAKLEIVVIDDKEHPEVANVKDTDDLTRRSRIYLTKQAFEAFETASTLAEIQHALTFSSYLTNLAVYGHELSVNHYFMCLDLLKFVKREVTLSKTSLRPKTVMRSKSHFAEMHSERSLRQDELRYTIRICMKPTFLRIIIMKIFSKP
jgi:hypothetical protein